MSDSDVRTNKKNRNSDVKKDSKKRREENV
jgi:hypothetical protein